MSRSNTIDVPQSLIAAVKSTVAVTAPQHSLYKYPARFSPEFAREAIFAFTRRGDTVLDPFCGGGTTLVEAMAVGRRAAGFDISSLATFLSRTKTSPLSSRDNKEILRWLEQFRSRSKSGGRKTRTGPVEEGYYRNLPIEARTFFEDVLSRVAAIKSDKQKRFVRLSLLSVGQSVLDCKDILPSATQLELRFVTALRRHIDEHYIFLTKVAKATETARCRLTTFRRVVNRPSEDCSDDGRIPEGWLPAKLVLTSPPYPGVHVVYHRWQIRGRRETGVPFLIANSRDGAGESHYCLGSRAQAGLSTYFTRLRKSFAAVRNLVGPKSLVVQLVAFADPSWQLPRYLEEMKSAGFVELTPRCDSLHDGRVWRDVPGRKWYATNRGQTGGAREVVLFHRPG